LFIHRLDSDKGTTVAIAAAGSGDAAQEDDNYGKRDKDPFDPSEALHRIELSAIYKYILSLAVKPATEILGDRRGSSGPEDPREEEEDTVGRDAGRYGSCCGVQEEGKEEQGTCNSPS
jgi:hypothetical protein